MTVAPKILTYNPKYINQLLNWHGINYSNVGKHNLFKIQGCSRFNNLLDINKMFSRGPRWHVIDRSQTATSSMEFSFDRPWVIPTQQYSLDQALALRVQNLASLGQPLNVFWSGGIDSTAMATAFLKHLDDKSQLRIIYSPWSTYEHPDYLEFLSKFSNVTIVDFSGTRYLDNELDGIFITGDGGDELTSSIDESWFEMFGYHSLQCNWKDFFYKRNGSDDLIDFCEEFFAKSGRDINSVLEARWWFYAICKNTSLMYQTKLPLFLDFPDFTVDKLQGFYNCKEFESFIYWNIDKTIISSDYQSYKQFLKDYCYDFDNLKNYKDNKMKFGSGQLNLYIEKKLMLKDLRWLLILSDGTRIHTPNMPLHNEKEYRKCYGNQLDYLFNNVD